MSNFEPQCKTRADLHDHMARVLRMCEADAAVMSGDVVRMIKAYEDLKGYKE